MAATGSSITVFLDFLNTTGISIFSGVNDIVNDAMRQTYMLKYFMAGKTAQELLQGGSTINDDIYLTADSSAVDYNVNTEFDYRIRDVLQQWSIPWRFTSDHYAFTEHQIELNTGNLATGARHHMYKSYKRSMEQNLATGLINFLDDHFYAQPSTADMEAATGLQPYSIIPFIHENSFVALATGATVGYAGTIPAALDLNGTVWTTIMGINPAVETGWQNPVALYSTYGNAAAGADIFDAFEGLYTLLHFDALPWRPEMGKASMLAGGNAFIAASLKGKTNYVKSLISSKDSFLQHNDPSIPGPQYMGVPMVYIRRKDTAVVYPTAAAAGASTEEDQAGADNAGPRYEFINTNFTKKVFHSRRYMYVKPPFFPDHQPFNLIVIADTWHNNFSRSRLRGGGVVAPGPATAIAQVVTEAVQT